MHYIFQARTKKYKNRTTRELFLPYEVDDGQYLCTDNLRDFYTHETLAELLSNIPQKERYNLHLTLWNSEITNEIMPKGGQKTGRECSGLGYIAWDIDDCVESEREQVIEATFQAINLNISQAAVVWSGNGVHVIVPLPLMDLTEAAARKSQYLKTCQAIQQLLFEKGLSGHVDSDTSPFTENKMLRLPNTTNIKEENIKACVLLHEMPEETVTDFMWPGKMIEQGVTSEDYVSQKELAPVDTDSVLGGCGFLAHAKDNQANMQEPEWYAAINILAFMPGGKKLCHDYSRKHPSYNPEETDAKYEQAKRLTGPRTCKNIEKLFPACHSCPFFGKVRTPLQIHAPDFVTTKHSGYWFLSKDGKPTKPDYDGLTTEFSKEFNFICIEDRTGVYIWNGTHYEKISNEKVMVWVEHKMVPSPETKQRQEFLAKLRLKRTRSQDFFTHTIKDKMNLGNGVLNLKTMELKEHSMKNGFLSVFPFTFDKAATCPIFDKFLDEVTEFRKDDQALLMEWFGYCLEGGPIFQEKVMFMIGEGSNGKSTLVNVMRRLFGGATTSIMAPDLNKENYRVNLEFSKINIAEETPSKKSLESSIFKLLTTTETKVTAKQLYEKSYEFTNRCKFTFLSNHQPYTDDRSTGFMRRLVIVPFNRHFAEHERDYGIGQKLELELSGIFNKCLDALMRFKKQGSFTESNAARAALDTYRNDNDYVYSYCINKLTVTNNEHDVIASDTVFSAYGTHIEEVTGEQSRHIGHKQVQIRKIVSYLRTTGNAQNVKTKQVSEKGVKKYVITGIQPKKYAEEIR